MSEKKEYSAVVTAQDNVKKINFYDETIEKSCDRIINSSDGVSNETMTFHMPQTTDRVFTDLTSTEIIWKLQLLTGEGGEIPTGQNVGLINQFVQSQMESIKVELQGKEVWGSGNYYPELSYIDAQTKWSKEDKDTWGWTEGYIEDNGVNATSPEFTTNLANLNRAMFFGDLTQDEESDDLFDDGDGDDPNPPDPPTPPKVPKLKYRTKPTTFRCPIRGGIFEADNHLPPRTNLVVKITMKPSKYVLFTSDALAGNSYQLKVKGCSIKFRQLTSTKKYWDEYVANWKENPVKLRFSRIPAISINLTTTSLDQEHQIKNAGINPKRIMIVFRDAKYVKPANNINPLYFTNFFEAPGSTAAKPKFVDLEKLELCMGGVPLNDLRDMAENRLSLTMLHYRQFLNHFYKYGNSGLGLYNFQYGRYIVPYDLSTTQRLNEGPMVREPVNNEDLRLTIKLSNSPKEQVQCLVFSEYECSVTIDFNSTIVQNFFD
jgi:hypothetical protein